MGQLTQLELPFHALFAGGRERKFQGAKDPHLELSLPGANGLGSKKSSYHFTLCGKTIRTFRPEFVQVSSLDHFLQHSFSNKALEQRGSLLAATHRRLASAWLHCADSPTPDSTTGEVTDPEPEP